MGRKIGFYPGCSLEGTAREYSESVLALGKIFDIELIQVPDWNCCGATAAHNLDKILSLSLAARILAQASAAEMEEVVVPCAACYNRLTLVQHELRGDEKLKKRVEEVMGMELGAKVRVLNVIQFLQEYVFAELPSKIKRPFDAKVACYYGCLLVRPNDILGFDRAEDPQMMDEAMRALGAETVEWPFKTECCGAGFSMSRTDIVARLSGNIVKEAQERGAEAIVVACPMCHSNLDMRRGAISKYLGVKSDIPVIYITQAIGAACGLGAKETGSFRHFVKVDWGRLTKERSTNTQEE